MTAISSLDTSSKDTSPKETSSAKFFTIYSWAMLAYLLFVILFGAWVRITHSGAGCGSHWPTCHGDIIPFEPSIETMIEYTHRLTSGLLGIFGLISIGWAAKRFGKSPILWATIITYFFILFEGAIGAGLVLGELVTDNDSVARAVVIALHLANTLSLTAAAGLTAWWSTGREIPRRFIPNKTTWFLIAGLIALVITSMTGAVTALGDTLFPVDPTLTDGLAQRVRDDLSAANHFLVRLRIVHPFVAILTALYMLVLAYSLRLEKLSPTADRWTKIMATVVISQVLIGLLNIALAAPGWLQLVHLLLAQIVWLALVFLTVTISADQTSSPTKP